MKLDTQILRSREAIDALADEWELLLHDSAQDFDGLDATMGFVWFDALRAAFPAAAKPWLVSCRREGELVGLLPVLPLQRSLLGARLALPTELYGGRCGPLLHPDPKLGTEALGAMLSGLAREGGRWSSLQLTLTEGSGAERLRSSCWDLGWRWQEEAVPASAGFPMPAPGAPLRDSLSSSVRQNLRSAQNKAVKLGLAPSVREFTDPAQASELLDIVLRIERSSWKHEAGSAITNHPQQQAFYAELFPRGLRTGLLRAWVLDLGGEPAAHLFGLLRDGVFCCLKHSQVQAHDAVSPSNLLMADLLPRLADSGAIAFDWMGVVEPHKLRWSPANFLYQRRQFQLYHPGPAGRLHAGVVRLRARWAPPRAASEASEAQAADPNPQNDPKNDPRNSAQGNATPEAWRPRVVERGPELDALLPAWTALVRERPEDLLGLDATNLPCWLEALANSRPAVERVRVLLLEQGELLQAALPLVVKREGWSGRRLTTPTDLYGGRNGPLLGSDSPELAGALLQGLATAEPRWVSLKITVLRDGAGAHALREAAKRLGMDCLEHPVPPAPFVHLLGSSEQFLQGVSKSLQRNLRQSQRLAAERGTVRWREFEAAEDAEALLAVLLEVERHSWKHEAGSSVSRHPEQEAFYRALAPLAMREGRLYALVLYLDEIPISYQLGLQHGEVYLCLKNSMRADARDLRPSHLLKMELFNRLRERGVKTVDLMGVVEPHKLVWSEATPSYARSTLYIHRNNWAGRLVLKGRTLRAWLARRRKPVAPPPEGTES